MKKIKRYLPFFLISLVISTLLAGYCLNLFISESRKERDEKVSTIFAYIRETLDKNCNAILEQAQNHRDKMSASVQGLGNALWLRYGFGLQAPKGNELEAYLGKTLSNPDSHLLALAITDEQGTILQWLNGSVEQWDVQPGETLQSLFGEKAFKGEALPLSSPVTLTPAGQEEKQSITVYASPIGDSRLSLLAFENEFLSASEGFAAQYSGFISNLDDHIIFLDIDPTDKIITNVTPFDGLFTVTQTDEESNESHIVGPREIAKLGITEKMLSYGYRGNLTVQGTGYSCRTLVYRSEIFPNGKTILALIPTGFTSDISYTAWVAVLFFVMMLIYLLYCLFMKGNATQTAKPEDFIPVFGGKLYWRKSFWRKLSSAGAITLCMIMLVSLATVTLGQISRGMRSIRSRHESISKELSENSLLQQQSDETARETYRLLTEAALLSIRADPEELLSSDAEPVPFFLTNEYGLKIPYADYSGRDISCRVNCTGLKALANRLGFSSAALFNVDGYPIAGSQRSLPKQIGKDSPFYPMLNRQTEFVFSQYDDSTFSTAIAFDLYSQTDENGEERLLSEAEYEAARAADAEGLSVQMLTLVLVEKEDRSAVRSGIQQAASLLEQDTISGNSYLLYADDENRTPLFIPSILNGIAADSIAVPKEALQNEYYGFVNLGGMRYLLYSHRMTVEDAETGESTSYWLVALQEKESVFHYRLTALKFVGLISLLLLTALVLSQSFCTEGSMRKILTESEGIPRFRRIAGLHVSSIIYWIFVAIIAVILLFFIFYWRRTDTVSVMQWIGKGLWSPGVSVFAITSVCLLISCAFLANNLLKKLAGIAMNVTSSRVETLIKLLFSILRYAIALFVIFYSLYLFGMNTGSVLASLGLVSMVIGLGANKLIADIVAGIFIIMEEEFRVGDIVTIGSFVGRVTEIGVRTTKIENADGNVNIFTNSSIQNILNMTAKESKVNMQLKIRKNVPIEKVEEMLQKNLPILSEKCPFVHKNLAYKGISDVSGPNNVYLIEANCSEYQKVLMQRYLNKEISRVCKENSITIW